MLDQSVGHIENLLSGAVILFQSVHGGAGIIPLIVEDISDLRPAESVNALVGVADDKKIPLFSREVPQNTVLSFIGVLIFVNKDIGETFAIVRENIVTGGKKLRHIEEKIVKIQSVIGFFLLFIQTVRTGHDLFFGSKGHFFKGLGAVHFIFRVGDHTQSGSRGNGFFHTLLLQQRFYKGTLIGIVIDHEIRRNADRLPFHS